MLLMVPIIAFLMMRAEINLNQERHAKVYWQDGSTVTTQDLDAAKAKSRTG